MAVGLLSTRVWAARGTVVGLHEPAVGSTGRCAGLLRRQLRLWHGHGNLLLCTNQVGRPPGSLQCLCLLVWRLRPYDCCDALRTRSAGLCLHLVLWLWPCDPRTTATCIWAPALPTTQHAARLHNGSAHQCRSPQAVQLGAHIMPYTPAHRFGALLVGSLAAVC